MLGTVDELNELPVNSYISDNNKDVQVWQKGMVYEDGTAWFKIGTSVAFPASVIPLPAHLLNLQPSR